MQIVWRSWKRQSMQINCHKVSWILFQNSWCCRDSWLVGKGLRLKSKGGLLQIITFFRKMLDKSQKESKKSHKSFSLLNKKIGIIHNILTVQNNNKVINKEAYQEIHKVSTICHITHNNKFTIIYIWDMKQFYIN